MNRSRRRNCNTVNAASLARWIVMTVFLALAGLAYAFIQANQPYVVAIGRVARGQLGPHAHPEVWDRAFNREIQPWVRIVFKNGTAIQGIARMAGLSPASRQLLLVALRGVPESLVRLDEHGYVADDLTARAEGVWVEIGSEVLFVEVFG